jgi:hypothetical protein
MTSATRRLPPPVVREATQRTDPPAASIDRLSMLASLSRASWCALQSLPSPTDTALEAHRRR